MGTKSRFSAWATSTLNHRANSLSHFMDVFDWLHRQRKYRHEGTTEFLPAVSVSVSSCLCSREFLGFFCICTEMIVFRLSGESLFSVNCLWLSQHLILKCLWILQINTSISFQVHSWLYPKHVVLWLPSLFVISMTYQFSPLSFTSSFSFSFWISLCTCLTSCMALGCI